MKMDADSFETLRRGIEAMIQRYPGSQEKYAVKGLTDRRWRWDLFWAANDAGLFGGVRWFADLHDEHIDTALRKITNTK